MTDDPTGDPFEIVLRDLSRAPAIRLSDLDLTGRAMGRYEVIRRVGAGGMGVVYEARDTRLQRHVALKVLHVWRGDAHAGRLVAEARRAAAMRHPNIAAVFDVDTIEGVTFMALELCDGRSLKSAIASGVDPVTAWRWSKKIASALGHAHLAGIIHRDITPSNVMIGAGGALKLLDFGIATARPGIAVGATGTPGYRAPEQASGGPVDARADVYSFGVLLREMIASEAPARPTDGLRRSLGHLADRCASRDPGDRPRDGTEVSALLRAIPRDDHVGRGRMIGVGSAALAIAAIAAGARGSPQWAQDPVSGTSEISRPDIESPSMAKAPSRVGPRVVHAPRGVAEFDASCRGVDDVKLFEPLAREDDVEGMMPAREAPHDLAVDEARLPVTAAVDPDGRIVAIADLRAVGPHAGRAVGRIRDLGAPAAGKPAQGPSPALEGTMVVTTAADGSMRVVLDLRPKTMAPGEPEPIAANDPPPSAGEPPAKAPGPSATAPPSKMAVDAGTRTAGGTAGPSNAASPPNKSHDVDAGPMVIALAERGFARAVTSAICGVLAEDELWVSLDESGRVHIEGRAPGEEVNHLVAVIDDDGIHEAHPGVGLCPDDSFTPPT